MSAKNSKTKNLRSKRKILPNRTNLKENPNTNIETNRAERIPDVIVDFEYEKGLLFLIIENIGIDSAYDTEIRFNKKILGVQKTKEISSLGILQSLKFLPPGKKIKIFVDSFQFYLAGKQPLQLRINISFKNKLKQIFENTIQHDLSIYKEISEICHIQNYETKTYE